MPARCRLSSFDSGPEQQGWAEEAPPVLEAAHLRITLLGVVANGARDLDDTVAAPDRLVEHVRLQVVAREPVLVDVHGAVTQDVGLQDPESVRRIGDSAQDQHGEDDRVQPSSEAAMADGPLDLAALHPARSL